MMRSGHLPVSMPTSNAAKKERWASRSRVFPLAERWIHAIPVIVLLCFFILWWLSRPVSVEIKDGRIVAIHQVDMPLPNDSQIDVAILASATSPIASVSVPQILTGNGTEAQLAWNKSDSGIIASE